MEAFILYLLVCTGSGNAYRCHWQYSGTFMETREMWKSPSSGRSYPQTQFSGEQMCGKAAEKLEAKKENFRCVSAGLHPIQ